jgi:hypothetical protein
LRAPRRTRIPDFDRPVVRSGDNLGPVRGERHRRDCLAVGICLLAQQLQFVCETSQQASVWPRRGDFEGFGAPESQTLIVLSHDPDTILVPSGENATDEITQLWAFVFSLSSSSVSARQANRRQSWPRRGDSRLRRTRIPDFDRPVVRSRHDLGPVRGKRHRVDWAAVGLCLLAQQPQRACCGQASRHQFWPRRGDFELAAHLNPRLGSSRGPIRTQSWSRPGKTRPTRSRRCGRLFSRSTAPARLPPDKPAGVSFGRGGRF